MPRYSVRASCSGGACRGGGPGWAGGAGGGGGGGGGAGGVRALAVFARRT